MEQEKRQRLRVIGVAFTNKITHGLNHFEVLCLHGYRQNAQMFQKKTGALRKAFKSRLEFGTFVGILFKMV